MSTSYEGIVVGTGHAGCEVDALGGQTEELCMDETITTTPTPKTAAEYEAAVDALLAELARMNERSEQTWAEIERLKGESAAIQAEKVLLNASIDRRLEALTRLL